jgi:hypothetical protein
MEIKKEKKTLAQAMLDFRVNVDSVTKDGTNPHYGNAFATYNAVQEAITPTLDMLGMVVIQAPMILDGTNVLNTKIYLADNPSDTIESNLPLLTPKNDMQQLGGALTYARRQSLVSLFGLASEDDDGNQASEKPTAPVWEDANDRNSIITDVKAFVDDEDFEDAWKLLDKSSKHKEKAIENKRKNSLWGGLGNEYTVKLNMFRKEQNKVA